MIPVVMMIQNLMAVTPKYCQTCQGEGTTFDRQGRSPPVGDPSMEHMSVGKASDGIIYLNDDGETVKLDRKGNPIRLDQTEEGSSGHHRDQIKIYSRRMESVVYI